MHISQETFERACSYVIATVREHHDEDVIDGLHGALRSLGVNPESALDVAQEIAAGADSIEDGRERGGVVFVMGMLVGVHIGRGAAGGGEADAT